MNLKTFAVHQKLNEENDDLLKYVVKNEPVPISVLEQSFGNLLTPLQDVTAETLIQDHVEALSRTIPLIVTVLPTGGYDVSGEIPDNIVEAVSLVHNLDADDIVTELVNHQLESVYNKTCDITDLSIDKDETAKKTITTDLIHRNSDELPDFAGNREEITETIVTSSDKASLPVDEKPAKEEIFGEAPEEPLPEMATEPVTSDVTFEAVTGEPPADTFEEVTEEPSAEFEDAFEEPPEEILSEEEEAGRQVMEAMQRIYVKFCNDLVTYGLDERLNLNI